MSARFSMPATAPAPRTLARELSRSQLTGERVLLQGWLHHQRHLKAVDFLLLRDRSGITQVVVEDPPTRERLAALPHETALTVTGTVVASPQAARKASGSASSIGPSVMSSAASGPSHSATPMIPTRRNRRFDGLT